MVAGARKLPNQLDYCRDDPEGEHYVDDEIQKNKNIAIDVDH